MYEFWVQPQASKVQPTTTLTLTLVNWHPIGRGKPVCTHRTSWRVDHYEALPASLPVDRREDTAVSRAAAGHR